MTEQSWPGWYSAQFERAAQCSSLQLPPDAPDELLRDLKVAAGLAGLDFSAESSLRKSLRDRLSQGPARHPGRFSTPLLRLGVLALALLALLMLTNSPVLAAFGRFFGYGYLSQTGFIRLDQTLLLPGPLLVEGSNRFSVSLVVAGRDSTRIWLAGGPVQPSGLELEDGSRLAPLGRESLSGGTALWSFGPLPAGQRRPTLLLQDGQRVPLGLIPAGEAGLAPTAVSLPARTPSGSPAPACLADDAGAKMCVQAAQVDVQGLHLLVELKPAPRQAAPDLRDWGLILVAAGHAPNPLKAVQPGDDPGTVSLLFAPSPVREGSVTLRAAHLRAAGPLELTFSLPESKPSVSPTPRVIQTPFDQAAPAPTPGLP